MTVPMTSPGYADDSMADRMSATLPGQVTWVDYSKASTCTKCAHYTGKPDKGRCSLVKVMTKKPGLAFAGTRARACSKFEALT